MEVKILCPCGSKYKFDVEPLGGKLPGPVICPVCGADGTTAGNEIIARALIQTSATEAEPASASAGRAPHISIPQSAPGAVRVGTTVSSKPAPAGGFVAPPIPRSSKGYSPANSTGEAPAAITVAEETSAAAGESKSLVPQPTGSVARLSVAGGHGSASANTQAPPAPAPVIPAMPARPAPLGMSGPKPPSNARGLVGAALGGIVGMVIWAGLIVVTETEIGWVAWGVGLLTGYSARLVGRGYSPQMGLAAAVAALVAILAGQFLAVKHSVNSFIDTAVVEGYDESMEYAKDAVNQKTDQQIRVFLANEGSVEDEVITPAEITSDDIRAFRDEMPTYRKMAAGQYSRTDYERENRALFEEFFTTGMILQNSFSLWTILWILLGVGSAWRLASGG